MQSAARAPFLILTTVALVLPRSADAQGSIPPQSAQGLFTNWPVGLTVVGDGEDHLVIRAPGTNGGVPVPWSISSFGTPAANRPDYSVAALNHWATGLPEPEFGGISTGGEVMPRVDDQGRMIMTTTNWFMLAVSVKNGAEGAPGSLLEAQRALGRDPSGDILSYYAIDSSGIHEEFVDSTRLEYSREQLRLQQMSPTPNGDRSVGNLDFGMGVLATDPGERVGPMFPVKNLFYFTLTKQWVLDAQAANPSFLLDGAPPNASTVYVMPWSMTPIPGWAEPKVAFSHATLFPNRVVGSVEIDALSVYLGGGEAATPDRVVFSATADSDAPPTYVYDQILVYQRAPNAYGPMPLKTDDMTAPAELVSAKLGLMPRGSTLSGEPDDVGSTCGGDPIDEYAINPILGMATDQTRSGEGRLGITAVRAPATPNTDGSYPMTGDTLHVQIQGLEYGPYELGFVQLQLEGPAGSGSAPIDVLPPIWIDPASEFRNALEVTTPIPYAPSTVLRLSARIIGYDYFTAPDRPPVDLRESWVISISI